MMDPVLGNASVMVLVKNAPHPHAALLLMDFLVSDEGQKVIRDADYFPVNPRLRSKPQSPGSFPPTTT